MSSTQATSTAAIGVTETLTGKEADYVPIAQEYLRAHPSASLTAVINMLNCHMADMFITMLTIMGDKYGHTIDEMIDAVKADPRWDAVQTHPLVKSLSYFDQRDADRAVGSKTKAETPTETLQESMAEIKKARLKKAAATATTAAAPEEAAAATAEEIPKPTKKTTKKVAAPEEGAVTAATTEEAPKPAKKTTKKAAMTAAEVIVTTGTHADLGTFGDKVDTTIEPSAKPVKKTTKKAAVAAAAATTDDATEAITEKVKALAVSEAPAKPVATVAKKTVPKKTATK
jgi:hypothetical protein